MKDEKGFCFLLNWQTDVQTFVIAELLSRQ